MGGAVATWDQVQRRARETTKNGRSAEEIMDSTDIPREYDPRYMSYPRVAHDSSYSPNSKGIIFAEDLTGSMGTFLYSLMSTDLPRLIKLIHMGNRTFDPHVMFMGVCDVAHYFDKAPLQVTQFEADTRMVDHLQRLYLQKNYLGQVCSGGGNGSESYHLPWYFAGKHIEMHCWSKRKEKGFLFTSGDDGVPGALTSSQIHKVFGNNSSISGGYITAEDCLKMASEKFNCYHIILHGAAYNRKVVREWKALMGGHACDLSDHHALPELVNTILKMHEGVSKTRALDLIEDRRVRAIVDDALIDHEEFVAGVSVAAEHEVEVF